MQVLRRKDEVTGLWQKTMQQMIYTNTHHGHPLRCRGRGFYTCIPAIYPSDPVRTEGKSSLLPSTQNKLPTRPFSTGKPGISLRPVAEVLVDAHLSVVLCSPPPWGPPPHCHPPPKLPEVGGASQALRYSFSSCEPNLSAPSRMGHQQQEGGVSQEQTQGEERETAKQHVNADQAKQQVGLCQNIIYMR